MKNAAPEEFFIAKDILNIRTGSPQNVSDRTIYQSKNPPLCQIFFALVCVHPPHSQESVVKNHKWAVLAELDLTLSQSTCMKRGSLLISSSLVWESSQLFKNQGLRPLKDVKTGS